jgi:hypothetical protein
MDLYEAIERRRTIRIFKKRATEEDYELTCVLKFGVPGGEVTPPKRRPEFSWLHKNKF